MTLAIYIAAILIAKSINPNFIGENLILCVLGFAVCAILQLFYIAMAMHCPEKKPSRYEPEVQKKEHKKTTL